MELHPSTPVSSTVNLSIVQVSREAGVGRRHRQELYIGILGKQDFGTPRGNVQFKTKVLISVERTIKTIVFLKKRTTKFKRQIPKNVTIESQRLEDNFSALAFRLGFGHSFLSSLPSKYLLSTY